MSWIMVAGPYSSNGADAAQKSINLRVMNTAALRVFEKGHIPIIGVNMALPMIECAGEDQFEGLMMPISLALADKCDAILRIGGPSAGADQEVARLKAAGKRVYVDIDDIPDLR